MKSLMSAMAHFRCAKVWLQIRTSWLTGGCLAACLATLQADSVVVFNEIMYHPATNEPAFEWVELHNQMAVDVELSGWTIESGIEYSFPEGTIIPGGGYLVVALSPTDLAAATGLTNVLGPFSGRLANNGEKLELYNNNHRLMDEVNYGVEGKWPVAPDGAGPSLAKFDEDSASGEAANWRASLERGGTPGRVNFPARQITIASTDITLFDSTWRYTSSNADPGAGWREDGFDDTSWNTGAGLFFGGLGTWRPGETGAIPLFNSGVDSNRLVLGAGSADPHYLLTAAAQGSTPTAATVAANHPNWLANDAESSWISVVSQGNQNVAAGGYTYRTVFSLAGFDPTSAQITLLVAVDNDLTSVLLNGASIGLTYSGFTAFSAPFVRSSGFVAGTNTLDFITVNASTTANPAGFRVKASGTARKLIPTNSVLQTGTVTHFFRRTFVFQDNPANAGLQLRALVDDGAVVYLNGVEVLRLNLPDGTVLPDTTAVTNVGNAGFSGPFTLATASLRPGANVLAVELHQAADGTNDVLFGAELALTVTNYPPSPPPTLAFNEMSSVTNAQFWVEIMNYGAQDVALDQCILARFGTFDREFVLPAQTIPAGGFAVIDRAMLGFGADPGDRVILYSPDRSMVYDAMVAKSFARARYPDGTGVWRRPLQTTPGATNIFAFHDEIVINEIMYHARDLPPVSAVYFTNTLLTLTNVWRYNQSGQELGTAWREPEYDDTLWPTSRAAFYAGFTSLPVPRNTSLSVSNAGQGIITYYFRAPVVLTNTTGLQFYLRHLVDDGAIFYWNGAEIYRYGMPSSDVTATTLASTNIGVPAIAGPLTMAITNAVMGTNLLAVEVHQYLPPPGSRDLAFALELVATGLSSPALPLRDSPESWIELYNRGTNPVDLAGWELTDDIDFRFAPGSVMAPGTFLVVAKEVGWMQSNYSGLPVTGPFTNRLSRRDGHLVLRDAMGNPANEVRFLDGFPWPSLPNGSGASLELRDPRADNTRPEAWAASDDRAKAPWQTITYRGTATVEAALSPTLWNEFVLGLLGEGEVLLDDISVLESPSGARRQLIQNGSFETGLGAWRIIGNHRHSQVVVDPANAANHVLRLTASGDTDHMHNHAETTLANGAVITNGVEYEISFRARWVKGCNRLNTRLYFNRLARTTELAVPALNGTPGARNSCYTNIGPTFEGLHHEPAAPTPAQPVTVSVKWSDPDGLAAANLHYSVNEGAWQSVPMTNGASAATIFAIIPTQSAGAVVQFYVSAVDGLGAVSTAPAGGINSRALYRVSDAQSVFPGLHVLRLIMTASDATTLHAATNVMSNERLGCTMIYNERQIFYDARVHLQGSERGRNNPTRVGFTVRLPKDNLFRGVHKQLTIDRSGGYSGLGGDHDEILLKHAINKAGGLPGMYDDLVQCFAPRASEDSTGLLLMAKYGEVFLDSQYHDGGAGEMYKLELIYYPTTTVIANDPQSLKLPQPDTVLGTDIKDLGDDPEAYRWIFLKENHVASDQYGPMIAVAKACSLTGTNLEARLPEVMDVDEWLRAVAFLGLIGGGDMYTYGNSHNLIIYFRPEDQKGMAFLWDLDYSFVQSTTQAYPGTGSANTYKIITTIPNNYRRYCNHLYDLATITGNSAYLGEWSGRYAGLLRQNWSGVVNYLAQRAAYVRGTLPLTTAFSIASYGGNNFAVSNSLVALTGTAPISVRDIEVNGIRRPVTWNSLTEWTLQVPLPAYTNLLAVQGVDGQGNRLTNAVDTILVTNLSVPALQAVVINEWMADNAGPGGFPDPADGRFQDWFELYNPNAAPVNLSGYFLTDDLRQPTKWTIPPTTVIPGRGFLLVWADENGAQNGLGTNGDLHANFRLDGAGEAIGLCAPDGTPQHQITFGPQFQNVSQGLFPDGDTNRLFYMTNWSPRMANRLGTPPAPALADSLVQASNRLFSFSFTAIPLRTYWLEYADRIGTTNWTRLGPNLPATGTVMTIQDNTAGQTQRFYRVLLVP